ncbi:DUF3225 domain-containing protein [Propioniciclava soli]|uniref:DUF3225 domain-containing protein n=1 Tax=Propioniciclava soli TaxID=2775081 RepID=A0ABZ3CAU7_9ACTN
MNPAPTHPDRWRADNPDAPAGLLEAFCAYEDALMADDLAVLDDLFADAPGTLRGDPEGLLVGHAAIGAFRAVRGGAPSRTLAAVRVVGTGETAVVVAVTEPTRGGHGLQTQAWRRGADGAWRIDVAHVAPPPVTFDASVWRVVGDPLAFPTGAGPLTGESVAVKDLFAVAGHRVGAGVPAWLAEQEPAASDSAAVALLRRAGALIRGIARTDQFAYSLAGDNPHHGTPVNPAVPGALPGGSSSGSAVAVSLGAATIGLATDTAGSVRVPASYQGLWGWRPTHGGVPTGGLLPLAPDFDTVGLLTRELDPLRRAAAVLLGESAGTQTCGERVRPATLPGVAASARAAFEAWADAAGLGILELPDLAEAAEAFRVHQAWQAWQAHGRWLTSHPGAMLGAAGQRFAAAASVTVAEDRAARATLARWRATLDATLGDATLVVPSAASAAPRRWATPEQVDAHRAATFGLTCIAGITGRPAISAPLLTTPTGPVGVSFIGPRASDLALLEEAATLPVGVSPPG